MVNLKKTIPHYLSYNSQKFPNDVAIREKKFGIWRIKTWKQCDEEVKLISLGLQKKGIGKDSTIGLLGNNTPRWVIAEISSQTIKCNPMGIYSDALANEIDYLIKHSSCRTIFVEDEEPVLKSLLKFFQLQGYEVFGARSSEEALDSIQNSMPDIAVLDVMLHEGPSGDGTVDGFEICRKMRDSGFDKPVIFLSARA